jgi:hypothetical protein
MINFQAKLRKTGLRDLPAQSSATARDVKDDINKKAVDCAEDDEYASTNRPQSPEVIKPCRLVQKAGAENKLADTSGLIQPIQPYQ